MMGGVEVAKKLGYEVELRFEGKAKFYSPPLPSPKGYAPSSLPVFFNPVSKPNRDITILFLAAYFEGRKIRVCEALAGTGVRSIRIAVETVVAEEIIANDVSRNAYELIKINAELNGVGDIVRASNADANELLAMCGRGRPRYDYVDIDPAGSPAKFVENGFRGCNRGAVLGATATDMSALAGAKAESCMRKYSAKPLKTPFSKELGLRILAGFMVKTAARLGLASTPILSFQKDHYARVFVKVERGINSAKEKLRRMGWISYCPKCLAIYTRKWVEEPSTTCEICGTRIDYGGPLWLGELTDKELVSKILSRAYDDPSTYKESLKLLDALAKEDTSLIGYFPVNALAEKLRSSPVGPSKIIEGLTEIGYKATTTHIDPGGIRTDAPPKVVDEVFRRLCVKT
ncbi:MAG: tRNA (guanine(10)-N(2))-dimethyltransferase [Nitrososphaeria archaeon]|nr:tRNA (guanine(10)-N(2))-dimethyltransferase [Nitrososphaeria archaeon]